jgi:hypothetical protein
MKLGDFLSGKGRFPKGQTTQWLPFCALQVKTGVLWAGDPHVANAEDGCVVKVPRGKYVVEGIGLTLGHHRIVSRLRVHLATAMNPNLGKEVGEAGTDSAMIGVCDIKAFNAAFAEDGDDAVQEAIAAHTDKGFGIVQVKRRPGAIMPFVPTGSDGSGPVFALMASGKRVGFQLAFIEPESAAETPETAVAASLLGKDRDDFKTWALAGGGEVSCWLGGEIKAGADIHIWANAPRGPVTYRIRQGRQLLKSWTLMAKTKGGGARFGAVEVLRAGRYKIDFQIGKEIFSAIKLVLK